MSRGITRHELQGIALEVVQSAKGPTVHCNTSLLAAIAVDADAVRYRDGLLAGVVELVYRLRTEHPVAPGAAKLAWEALALLAERNGVSAHLPGTPPSEEYQALGDGEALARESVRQYLLDTGWPDDRVGIRKDGPATGLRAAIACAVAGQPREERFISDSSADRIADELERLGLSVDRPTVHQRGHDSCDFVRDIDVLVVLAMPASTRMGHQIARANNLLTPVVVVAKSDDSLTCLYDSSEAGYFAVVRYSEPAEVPHAVGSWVEDNLDLLRVHADFRNQRDKWHLASYEELRDAVLAGLANESVDEGRLRTLTRPIARHVVSSLEAYNGTGITVINALRARYGLAPLGELSTTAGDLAMLLTEGQRRSFYEYSLEAHLPPRRQDRILRAALAEFAAASSGEADSRSQAYTRVDHWSIIDRWLG